MLTQNVKINTKIYWKLEKKEVPPRLLPLHNLLHKLSKGKLNLFTTVVETIYGDDQGIILIKRKESDKIVYHWQRQVVDKKVVLEELKLNIEEDALVLDYTE